jgi:hypothetical protein
VVPDEFISPIELELDIALFVVLLAVSLLVPFDMAVLLPLSAVAVVPAVLQPKRVRLRVNTAMRGSTAMCVRFIG